MRNTRWPRSMPTAPEARKPTTRRPDAGSLLAARQNYDTAQLDLGRWMMDGRGGDKSRAEGFAWLLRAASGGNVAAQNEVAKLYMQGIGVEPDTIAAASWYFLARRAGLVDPMMEDFLDGLTDDEIKQALEKSNRLR